ncbi:MAG: PQQ-binding-like beta-propeller repeat protein [Pseudomonadota bacterium]
MIRGSLVVTVERNGQRMRTDLTRALLVPMALVLALAGCEKELVLEGERFPVRTDLSASLPEEGEPDPVSPPLRVANQSVPISLPGQVSNADWTHRAGNARHLVPHAALSAAPQRVWSAPIGTGNSRRNRIAAAPVVEGGRVFTIDARTVLTATTTGGGTLWSVDLTAGYDRDGQVSGGGLAASAGRIYATTPYGELVALDGASGAVVWRQRVESVLVGAPAVADGVVYVGARDGSAWAISAADGKVVWQVSGTPGFSGMLGSASPAVGDRAVVFPSSSGDLKAVVKTGAGNQAWQVSLAGKRPGRAFASSPDVTGDPVISNGTVYAGTAAGRTAAVSLSSGERLWSAGEGAMGPMVVAGGSLFLINDEARLVRLDAATGDVIWSVEMPYYVNEKPTKREGITAHYGPLLAGGRIVVASSDGVLRMFNPADGSLTATADIPGGAAAQPAVAGGTLYVVGGGGQLHAFR